MLPIFVDLHSVSLLLIGEGEQAERRLTLLDDAGAGALEVYSASPTPSLREKAGARFKGARPSDDVLRSARIVFLAGLGHDESHVLAEKVRDSGHFVNTEDVKSLCDFYVPSILRRGDLAIAVSTGGKAPGLARRLRRHLETFFGIEWADRLNELGNIREKWRSEGAGTAEVGRKVDSYIDEKGWLS